MQLCLFLLVFYLVFIGYEINAKPKVQFERKLKGPSNFPTPITDDYYKYDDGDHINMVCRGINLPAESTLWLMQHVEGNDAGYDVQLLNNSPQDKKVKEIILQLQLQKLSRFDNGTDIYCKVETKKPNNYDDSITSKKIRLVLKESYSSNHTKSIKNQTDCSSSQSYVPEAFSTKNGVDPAYFFLGFSVILLLLVLMYFCSCHCRIVGKIQNQRQDSCPIQVESFHQYETINEIVYTQIQMKQNLNPSGTNVIKTMYSTLPNRTNLMAFSEYTENFCYESADTKKVYTANVLYANENAMNLRNNISNGYENVMNKTDKY